VPFLHRKATPGASFEPKFEALESVLDAVARLVETKSPNDKKKDFGADENEPPVRHLTKLASAVHGYRAVLYAYLAEKEKIIVPTLRAFFTPEEVFTVFAETLRKTPKLVFGSLVHHLAGGEEAVKAFNARSVVSRSWRFGYGETVKHRAEYRAKMEFLLERLLAGDERLGKNKSAFGATNRKTTLERVNALTPLDLNERLVVNPTSSEALALAIADELGSGRGTVAGADVARSRTSQTKARLVNLAIGV
jgi:hypothetical protein